MGGTRTHGKYVVWLEWPERFFRPSADDMQFFKTLVPKGSRVVRATTEADFLRELPTATHAVVWHFKKEWFGRAPRLRVLATPAAGRELVPTAGPKGVTIHFGTFHGAIISETVLGFLLAWTHGFFRPGPLWPRAALAEHCGDLAGTTAVVAGFGHIGRAIATRLETFGVVCYGLTRRGVFSGSCAQTPLKGTGAATILRRADWLILALPSDTGTDDFLDARRIAQLPRRCVVVNVGRGNAIDEGALLAALEGGRLAGAYLDVFKQEPTALNPEIGPCGRGLAARRRVPWNLIRMPHSAAVSPRYLKECFKELKHEGLV